MDGLSYLLDRQISYARREPAAVDFSERLAIGLGSLRDILPARPVWTSGYVMGMMRQPVPVPETDMEGSKVQTKG